MKTNKNQNQQMDDGSRKVRLTPYKRSKRNIVDDDNICQGCGEIFPIEELDEKGMCPDCCDIKTNKE